MKSSFKKTALASVVAGALTAGAAIPQAEADVLYVSWSGAFTMLSAAGGGLLNSPSDYQFGYYANGDGSHLTYGAPKYPGNVGPNADCTSAAPLCYTSHGWNGLRTPVSGTMAFDVTNNAGVGTVNDFFFFGDTSGSGTGTHVARALGITFQAIDTFGTIVGTMLFSWNGGGHSVSIVLDGSGMFSQLGTANNPGPAFIDFMTNGPTTTIAGVGALPATDGLNFGSAKTPVFLPLGPSPIATKTINAIGCEGTPIATQTNAYTIVTNFANLGTCDLSTDDGIGGSPMVSSAFGDHNANFDIVSVHLDNYIATPQVPVPAAVWLFGSGLLGLVGIARRKKKA
jgi:hypothetical protein